MGPVRAMGARGRGPAQGDRRGDGLDRFRRRQSGHARFEPDHASRPGDAAPVADGRQGRTEGPAQRLRRPLPDAFEGDPARGRGGDDPGRSRLRRRQTVRIPRKPRLRLRHPLSRQRSCDCGGWPDAPGRRLGRQGRARAPPARRHSPPPATRSARRSASTPRG